MQLLKGGANNQVYLLEDGTVKKVYWQHHNDHRNRLENEWNFLSYAWSQGLYNIPKPIFKGDHYAIYSYVPGHEITEAKESYVFQALDFINQLNKNPFRAKLNNGSEACFYAGDHLRTIGKRVYRLLNIPEISEFVERELIPKWEKLSHHYFRDELYTPIISPSDFGFHNALVHHGEVSFLDFEYAGWDSPVKLICDFFCQVRVPVPMAYFDIFADYFGVKESCLEMMPLYKIKWCCILLNSFLPEGDHRRKFANNIECPEQQLEKARVLLQDVC